ncbi:MAG: YbhB/YbcL family Raf kinase inhibitor-like protein [Pirellulales bacterium]|nr:YbhB/YbcL family Raf kinase inhibitor-like protein [Pirellulales bacterium]
MAIQVTSTAFAEEERIADRYTGEGQDVSPPLSWSNLPEDAKELALICDDPDAPTDEPWVHWVIYKIPAHATGLPEGVPRKARLKDTGMLQGQNSWSTPAKPSLGYRGPIPPKGHGDHRYRFTLYALSGKLVVQPGVSKKQLLSEMADHVLDTGKLVGLYSR